MNKTHYEFAQLLVALWKLGNGTDQMPTSHGVLDLALKEIEAELPDHFKGVLTFGNTRVGFRCFELPEILYCAQASLLTTDPNPSYRLTDIKIDDRMARLFVQRLGISEKAARELGEKLVDHTRDFEKQSQKDTAA